MLDISLIVKLCAVVGSCVAVPLLATSLTNKRDSEIDELALFSNVQETGNEIGPIFTCSRNSKNYLVYLVPKNGQWVENSTEDSITLQVAEKESGKEEKKVVWGPKEESGNKWNTWNIDIGAGGTVILYMPDHNNNQNIGGSAFCLQDNKVDAWWHNYGHSQKFWEVKNGNKTQGANFQIDMQKCEEKSDGKKECNIKFKEGDPFQWKGGFQPKATISANSK